MVRECDSSSAIGTSTTFDIHCTGMRRPCYPQLCTSCEPATYGAFLREADQAEPVSAKPRFCTGRQLARRWSDFAPPECESMCSRPIWNDPFEQIASVAQLGGVRFPSIVRGELALRIVLAQLRERDGLSFTANIGHVDVSTQSSGRAYHRVFVSKPIDGSDNHSAVFTLAVGARLPPSVLPNVGRADVRFA
jgi:hypothetical protein